MNEKIKEKIVAFSNQYEEKYVPCIKTHIETLPKNILMVTTDIIFNKEIISSAVKITYSDTTIEKVIDDSIIEAFERLLI